MGGSAAPTPSQRAIGPLAEVISFGILHANPGLIPAQRPSALPLRALSQIRVVVALALIARLRAAPAAKEPITGAVVLPSYIGPKRDPPRQAWLEALGPSCGKPGSSGGGAPKCPGSWRKGRISLICSEIVSIQHETRLLRIFGLGIRVNSEEP